jgi:hypothetical protein
LASSPSPAAASVACSSPISSRSNAAPRPLDHHVIEGLLNIYATQIASLSSQIDYNPRAHSGITYANAALSIQPPWSTKGSAIYLGKALQGSFIEFAYNYASRTATVCRCRSIRLVTPP